MDLSPVMLANKNVPRLSFQPHHFIVLLRGLCRGRVVFLVEEGVKSASFNLILILTSALHGSLVHYLITSTA